MEKVGGMKGWLVLTGVAVLVALAAVPAFAGTASASPTPLTAADSPSNQWAYGGMGWANGTLTTSAGVTETYSAQFGYTVIITTTPTGPNTTMVEEQRTVGITLTATYSGPVVNATYHYHGQEVDVAFANLTNASTVYVNGSPVPALGIDNDSTSIVGSIAESLQVTAHGVTKSASLTVNGWAKTSAQFSPSLGLIPLNLSGVTEWNSSATVTPNAAWNLTWSWVNNGFAGLNATASGSSSGSVSTSGLVTLTGFDVTRTNGVPVFWDHVPRTAIVLIVQGPFGCYDLFVFVPHAFDLFGNGAHPFAANAVGSASISSETLYVSHGSFGPQLTAGATTFGAGTASVSALGTPSSGAQPAASGGPSSTTVTGSPMSVAQAQAIDRELTGGSASTSAPALGAGALVVVGAVAVAAVVATVALVEWRASARRRQNESQIGPYGTSGATGVPPATAPPTPAGPTAPEDPTQRL
jgi:hypothetical protein